MSSTPPPADPRIGMVLQDRYRILRKLGDGGMGSVYEGEHLGIKRRVAIKVLHAQYAQNKEITARFQREAEAATSIGHPHIVEVTDMGSFPDGTAYMVLELLSGRDWAKDIKEQGPQPLGKVVHILSQVCDALGAAHAKGIVHRDMKPENIYLIERHGDPCFVKILDFGISKIIDQDQSDRSLTQTGTALGTPYYMAPEQCQGKKDVDPRADVYSLGVILFQALTGQYPFDDESYPMLVLKICTEPPPQLSAFRADLPPEMQEILHRTLAKSREHRFGSAAELKAALAPFLGHTQAPVLAANAPRTSLHGPSVLEGARAATPTGTAVLETPAPRVSSVPSATPYPLAPPPSNRGLIFGVVAMLGLIVLVGGGLGAYFALSDGRGAHARAPETTAESAGPPEAPPAPVPEASPEPAAQPVVEPVAPTAPAAVQPEEPVGIRVTIRAPVGATLWIDEVQSANPFTATIAPGPRRVRASAPGYRPFEQVVPFTVAGQEYEVPMQRIGRPATQPVVAAPAPLQGGGGSFGQRPITSAPPSQPNRPEPVSWGALGGP